MQRNPPSDKMTVDDLADDSPPDHPPVRERVVREMVRKHFDVGVSNVTTRQLVKNIDGADINNNSVRVALMQLREYGVVEVVEGNNNLKRWRIVGTGKINPYRG